MRQVLRAGALARPRGMGWGGRREGGLGWGTHVNPRLIHVNVWQKPLQYCKVISLQLIKINGKKLDLKTKKRIYLQGNNGETDMENRLMDMERGEERVGCMKRVTWRLTSPYVKYGSGNSNRGSVST